MILDGTTLAAFAVASVMLLVLPGPTTLLILTRSLAEGRRVALPLVAGVALGDLAAASLALAGAGGLLAASATAFTVVKWIGAAYLIWLGLRLFRAPAAEMPAAAAATGRTAFRDGFVVTLFNPKGILFFVAFVPQFIRADAAYAAQAAVLVAVFVALAFLNGAFWALSADALRRVVTRPGALRAVNRAGGLTIAGAGVAALFTRRPA